MSGFRRGVRLGVDVGKARVGVARCDPDGMLAVPVETVPRNEASIARITALATEYDAFEVLVGLPVSLAGGDTASTADARAFARKKLRRGKAAPSRTAADQGGFPL